MVNLSVAVIYDDLIGFSNNKDAFLLNKSLNGLGFTAVYEYMMYYPGSEESINSNISLSEHDRFGIVKSVKPLCAQYKLHPEPLIGMLVDAMNELGTVEFGYMIGYLSPIKDMMQIDGARDKYSETDLWFCSDWEELYDR